MRKHRTITISIPVDLLDYLDAKINKVNRETFEETNRSKYIRLLIRRDMAGPNVTDSINEKTSAPNVDNEADYYSSLLQMGGYKR